MSIFISRGMTIAIPAGGLSIGIDEHGETTTSVTLHVRFDVCPTWIELALNHLKDAKVRRDDRIAAWEHTDEMSKGATLEREFESSMQAIMAAAIAIDAFYASIQTHVTLPPSLVETWRTKRTARYIQVTEVIRQAFALSSKGTATLRQSLKEIYKLRDLAVHPSGKIAAPILHPELGVGVEWRFAYFRTHNAELIVNATACILWDLANNGTPKDSKLKEGMLNLAQRLQELFPDGYPKVKILDPTV